MSVTYGINRPSALSGLSHFHPIECFPFDIMHVLFEGVVPLEVEKLLAHLIDEESLFSTVTLNHRLKYHNYGYSEADTKPTPIERASPGVYKIKQSGVSTCLYIIQYILVPWFLQLPRASH